ncbi:MAG: hypothetical protein R3B72_41440 [Polyangiaceae bacterium]
MQVHLVLDEVADVRHPSAVREDERVVAVGHDQIGVDVEVAASARRLNAEEPIASWGGVESIEGSLLGGRDARGDASCEQRQRSHAA